MGDQSNSERIPVNNAQTMVNVLFIDVILLYITSLIGGIHTTLVLFLLDYIIVNDKKKVGKIKVRIEADGEKGVIPIYVGKEAANLTYPLFIGTSGQPIEDF